ncbi:MAG: ATP-binding protein [Solibacillus sp.]
MLKMFSVSNYKIFNEKVTLDFSKVRDYKFNENCISNGLISKSIMYGKNAVGKTNLGFALIDIRFTVLPNERKVNDHIGYLNANSEKKSARFEYVFMIDNKEIEFIYEKETPNKLSYESLSIDNTLVYDFDFLNQNGNLNNLKGYEELKHLNFEEWDNEIPILRYILSNSKLNELNILKKLSKFIEGMTILKPSDSRVHFRGPKLINTGIVSTIIEEDLVHDFEKFLNNCDINIQLKIDITPEGEKKLYFDYKKPIEFINNASSGTLALTALYIFLKKLNKISFLFIDEFDANFHFELAERMLESVKVKQEAQIILTTHNTDLMTNKYLRPDCYFLMLPNKIVSIADATKRELRQGHNLEKLYQSGEFHIEA